MQAIVETLFDAVYLVAVMTIGILMIRKSKRNSQFRLFGWMAVVLGAGDSFHLIPRALALCTTGLGQFTVPLGLGKWITSVTMTIFYVLLYYIWRQRYQVKEQNSLTAVVYALAGVRILLCMMSQNQWLSAAPSFLGHLSQHPLCANGLINHCALLSECKGTQRSSLPLDVADYCAQLCFLYPSSAMGRYPSSGRDADDSQDLCLCLDSVHRIFCNEKRM